MEILINEISPGGSFETMSSLSRVLHTDSTDFCMGPISHIVYQEDLLGFVERQYDMPAGRGGESIFWTEGADAPRILSQIVLRSIMVREKPETRLRVLEACRQYPGGAP